MYLGMVKRTGMVEKYRTFFLFSWFQINECLMIFVIYLYISGREGRGTCLLKGVFVEMTMVGVVLKRALKMDKNCSDFVCFYERKGRIRLLPAVDRYGKTPVYECLP